MPPLLRRPRPRLFLPLVFCPLLLPHAFLVPPVQHHQQHQPSFSLVALSLPRQPFLSRHALLYASTCQPQHNSDNDDDDNVFVAQTQAWIQNMVIRIPLCPFAEKVVREDTVKYVVTRARKANDVAAFVLEEGLALVGTPEEETATTVIIAPNAFVEDFPSFYRTERFLEEHLEESPLGEEVLVASFHPQYTFGELDADDPIHYEKRSPFPVFNLLRAQRVWAYADQGLTEKIAENNAAALTAQGIKEIRRRFALKEVEKEGGGGKEEED